MPTTMPATATTARLNKFDGVRPRMAQVVNPVDTVSCEQRQVGRALEDAIKFLGLDDKDACEILRDQHGKALDKGLLSNWKSGERRLHLDRVLNTLLHGPFVIALARLTESCAVETTVSYRAVNQAAQR